MKMGPSIIIRAAIIGCGFIAALGYFATAGATPLVNSPTGIALPSVAVNTTNESTTNLAEATPVVQQPVHATKKNSKRSATSSCQVSDSFPDTILQWCDLISKFAQQRDIPADLIAAVMLQESGGDPSSYSKDGAVGLLQVMPKDGIAAKFMCIDGPCFTGRPSINELEDPQFNVEYGTAMLANLYEKYGEWRDALKAYGPSNMGYYYADLVLSIYNNYGKQ